MTEERVKGIWDGSEQHGEAGSGPDATKLEPPYVLRASAHMNLVLLSGWLTIKHSAAVCLYARFFVSVLSGR